MERDASFCSLCCFLHSFDNEKLERRRHIILYTRKNNNEMKNLMKSFNGNDLAAILGIQSSFPEECILEHISEVHVCLMVASILKYPWSVVSRSRTTLHILDFTTGKGTSIVLFLRTQQHPHSRLIHKISDLKPHSHKTVLELSTRINKIAYQ